MDRLFPDRVIFYAMGPNLISYDELKEDGFLGDIPVFVPKDGYDFYKKFKFNKYGFWKCYGLCYKGSGELRDRFKKLYPGNNVKSNLKGDMSLLGGSFIIDKEGETLFQHFDKYVGNHLNFNDIGVVFERILRVDLNHYNIEDKCILEEAIESKNSQEENSMSK